MMKLMMCAALALALTGCGATVPVEPGAMRAPQAGVQWRDYTASDAALLAISRETGARGAAMPLLVLVGKLPAASLAPGEGVTLKVAPGPARIVVRPDYPGHEHGYNGVMPATLDFDVAARGRLGISIGFADPGFSGSNIIRITESK